MEFWYYSLIFGFFQFSSNFSWFHVLWKIELDLEQGIVGALPIAPDYMGKEMVIDTLAANVEAMIQADRNVTALKQLQVS